MDSRVPWAIGAYAIAGVTLAVVRRRRANHIPAEVVGALNDP
jgi:hypothetical protein